MIKARILVVEDETIIAMEIEDQLKSLGYIVSAKASTGLTAIEKTIETYPDLILMDVGLNGDMDGIEAADHIRRRFDIPLIYLTAYADENTLQRAKITQPFGYLIKPFTERELHTAIEMALHKHQLEKQLRESEERYRIAAHTAADAIVMIDKSSRIIFANSAVEHIFGYQVAEIVNRPFSILIPVHRRTRYESLLEKYFKNDCKQLDYQDIEFSGLHKDGWEIPLEISCSEFTKNDERFFIVTIRDIANFIQVEQAMRKFSNALEQTPASVVITNREGIIEYVNPAFTQISGYTIEDVQGKTPRILKSGQHEANLYQELWDTILSGQVFRTEIINRKKNGELYYEEITINPLSDRWDNITHFIASAKDVTDRVLLEQKLTAIYELGQELTLLHDEQTVVRRVLETAVNILNFEVAGCGLVNEAADELDYRYYLINGGELKMSGHCFPLTGEQSIGVAVVRSGEVINLPDTTQYPRYVPIPNVPKGRSELCVPMRVKKRVIGVLNVESTIPACFIAADERLLQTLAAQAAVALENTRLYAETQQRAEQLAALHKLDQAITANLRLSDIYHVFSQHTARLLNYDWLSITLIEGEDVVIAYVTGRKVDTLSVGDTLAHQGSMVAQAIRQQQAVVRHNLAINCHLEPDKQLMAQGLRSVMIIPLRIKGHVIGTWNLASCQVSAYRPEDLDIAQAMADQLAIVIENSRLYEAERDQYRRLQQSQAQLVQVEKMVALGRLVASIAHEINNPLQAVQTSLTLVQEELEEEQRPDKLQHYVDIAGGEIDRIAVIIRRMREFYRPTYRSQDQDADLKDFYCSTIDELQTIHLHELLDNLLLLTNKQLQRNRIMIQRAWADDLPPIQGNPDHLKQVFLNLVLNANDAMIPKGGVLHISTEPIWPSILSASGVERGNEPMIRVKFGDTGEGMPPEVTSRLFEPLFTTKEHGSGFGLYTSYKIIEAHHGQITVESKEGTGTTFTILLPVWQPQYIIDEE